METRLVTGVRDGDGTRTERTQAQHDGIHAVQDRIGHICGFSPASGK